MEPSELRRAVEAAVSTASALGLQVDGTAVVHDGGRVAVRLVPCGVLARVAPKDWEPELRFEADVARRLTETDGPVGELEPRTEARVYTSGEFVLTFWTYYEPVRDDGQSRARHEEFGVSTGIAPADYAHALVRLHAGLRRLDVAAPHISDRVAGCAQLIADHEQTPALLAHDRELLSTTLARVGAAIDGWGADEQLLHGEPHPGNVLSTTRGPLFVDFHTCQRGPVEYDLGYVPGDVAAHYPGADQELVRQCRILMWAVVTAIRWRRNDQLPNRDYWRIEGLNQLRAALDR